MDVVTAIEGPEDAFRCTEIRMRGMWEDAPKRAFREMCAVQASMQRAELAWRRSLAAQTVADVRAEADLAAPTTAGVVRRAYGRD